jgi:hypothetical protein
MASTSASLLFAIFSSFDALGDIGASLETFGDMGAASLPLLSALFGGASATVVVVVADVVLVLVDRPDDARDARDGVAGAVDVLALVCEAGDDASLIVAIGGGASTSGVSVVLDVDDAALFAIIAAYAGDNAYDHQHVEVTPTASVTTHHTCTGGALLRADRRAESTGASLDVAEGVDVGIVPDVESDVDVLAVVVALVVEPVAVVTLAAATALVADVSAGAAADAAAASLVPSWYDALRALMTCAGDTSRAHTHAIVRLHTQPHAYRLLQTRSAIACCDNSRRRRRCRRPCCRCCCCCRWG